MIKESYLQKKLKNKLINEKEKMLSHTLYSGLKIEVHLQIPQQELDSYNRKK